MGMFFDSDRKGKLCSTSSWMVGIAIGFTILFLVGLAGVSILGILTGYVYFVAVAGIVFAIIDFIRLKRCPKVFRNKKIIAYATLALGILAYITVVVALATITTIQSLAVPMATIIFIYNAINLILSIDDIPIEQLVFNLFSLAILISVFFIAVIDIVYLLFFGTILLFIATEIYEFLCCSKKKYGRCDNVYYIVIFLAIICALLAFSYNLLSFTTTTTSNSDVDAAKTVFVESNNA